MTTFAKRNAGAVKTFGSYIIDDEFGRVRVRFNKQARRFTFRAQSDGLVLTCNPMSSESDIRNALDRLRPKLRDMLESSKTRKEQLMLRPGYRLANDIFELRWHREEEGRLYVSHKQGIMAVHYVESVDFETPIIQRWLVAQLSHNLGQQAKSLFPKRLAELAQENGFSYSCVRIRETHSRWGSCSSRGSINLNSHLVLLPRHLRDYVMLHELCHTREMNHSPKFWALLDHITGGNNKKYRAEIREYDKADIVNLLRQWRM